MVAHERRLCLRPLLLGDDAHLLGAPQFLRLAGGGVEVARLLLTLRPKVSVP